MWISINNPDQEILLAENWKWAWHLYSAGQGLRLSRIKYLPIVIGKKLASNGNFSEGGKLISTVLGKTVNSVESIRGPAHFFFKVGYVSPERVPRGVNWVADSSYSTPLVILCKQLCPIYWFHLLLLFATPFDIVWFTLRYLYLNTIKKHFLREKNIILVIFEAAQDKTYNKTCATSYNSDQYAYQLSLIRGFAFYSLQAIKRGINGNPCHPGWIYILIWVIGGYTGLIVGFVMRWLIYLRCLIWVYSVHL